MEPTYYAIIPASVRYDKKLIPSAKLLYGEITALSNKKGFCFASNEYFAELYGVSKKTISLWIKSLIDNGHLKSTITYKKGSKEIENRMLKIALNPMEEKVNTPLQKGNEGMEEKVTTPMEEKVIDNNTSTIITNNKHPLQIEFEETFLEFVKMRKEIGKKITERGQELIKNKLRKLSGNNIVKATAILNQSIENSWQGVFELKESTPQDNPNRGGSPNKKAL